ncbi:MAG: response regulator [Phycisphaerae bacterium]|nr:response regulator [Phycisphaerae bacterium]
MNADEIGRPVEILLVEDNPGDIELTREGLKEGKVKNNLQVVMDGEEAMRYLRREGEFADAVRPDMILLDLNLPRKDGREVLAEIRDDPDLEDIPVVVLTTSEADRDILKAYKLKANCYLTKPLDFEQFVNLVHEINSFWFTIVQLPLRP